VVYRKRTDTLLIASEGWDTLAEVDALTVDPAMFVRRTYDLGSAYDVARIDLVTGKASWLHLADDGLPVDAA
jgi:hypothetical protein